MAIDLTSAERRAMGDRLRAARVSRDLAQREVARHTGKSRNAVAAWERVGYVPDASTRAILADLYGMAETRLFAEYHTRRAELLAPLDLDGDDPALVGTAPVRRRAS
jgi:transcriptional regulator with XRE-family HTH domain